MRILLPLILLFGGAVHAQNPLPLPLQSTNVWCANFDETCPEPWAEYRDTDATAWYCEPDQRFCWEEPGGEGCGCSTREPRGWFPTGRRSVDYEAEITEHVIDVCYLEAVRRNEALAEMAGGEEQALTIMKAFNAEPIEAAVAEILPLVTGQDQSARMAFYMAGAATCIRASRAQR